MRRDRDLYELGIDTAPPLREGRRRMMPSERMREDVHEALDPYYDPDDQRGYGPEIARRKRDFYQGDPIGGEQLTVSNTVIGLAAVADYARSALCTVTGNSIRVTFSGRTPSSTAGHHFAVGEHFTITGIASLQGFRAIREGAADGTLDVTYFD